MSNKKWFYVLPYVNKKEDMKYFTCYSDLETALLNAYDFGKVYEITLKNKYNDLLDDWKILVKVKDIETEKEITPQEIKQFYSNGLFKSNVYKTLGFNLVNNNYVGNEEDFSLLRPDFLDYIYDTKGVKFFVVFHQNHREYFSSELLRRANNILAKALTEQVLISIIGSKEELEIYPRPELFEFYEGFLTTH